MRLSPPDAGPQLGGMPRAARSMQAKRPPGGPTSCAQDIVGRGIVDWLAERDS
jgi:hypothetical protein